MKPQPDATETTGGSGGNVARVVVAVPVALTLLAYAGLALMFAGCYDGAGLCAGDRPNPVAYGLHTAVLTGAGLAALAWALPAPWRHWQVTGPGVVLLSAVAGVYAGIA
jgi:hypothetical protein